VANTKKWIFFVEIKTEIFTMKAMLDEIVSSLD
jgi:hypothetical protein